jgi:hypothetical protein
MELYNWRFNTANTKANHWNISWTISIIFTLRTYFHNVFIMNLPYLYLTFPSTCSTRGFYTKIIYTFLSSLQLSYKSNLLWPHNLTKLMIIKHNELQSYSLFIFLHFHLVNPSWVQTFFFFQNISFRSRDHNSHLQKQIVATLHGNSCLWCA